MHTRGGKRNAVTRWRRVRGERGEVREAEAALTGLASAGIRALQILLVREPAAGIARRGVEHERYFALTFAVGCAFSAAFWPTSRSSAHRPREGVAKGVDEPNTVLGDRPTSGHTPTASDEKTFNLSISDEPCGARENIALRSWRQSARSAWRRRFEKKEKKETETENRV